MVFVDNRPWSSQVFDKDRITRLKLWGLSNSMSSVVILALIFSVPKFLLDEQRKVRLLRLGLLREGQFRLQPPSHQEFTWCKAILQGGSPVHEEGNIGVSCLAQEIFYRLHCALCFAFGLGVPRRTGCVREAKLPGKFLKLGAGELGAIVRHNDLWNAVGGENGL